MKRRLLYTILIMVLVSSMSILASCSASTPEGDTEEASEQAKQEMGLDDPDLENPIYANESEGATVNEEVAPQEQFYGSWTAGSDRAEYLYGNIDLTVNEDGSWTGNVTEEPYSGTWEYNGTGITLSSEFVNCDLFYADDGSLMFRDLDSPDILLVLTKAN